MIGLDYHRLLISTDPNQVNEDLRRYLRTEFGEASPAWFLRAAALGSARPPRREGSHRREGVSRARPFLAVALVALGRGRRRGREDPIHSRDCGESDEDR